MHKGRRWLRMAAIGAAIGLLLIALQAERASPADSLKTLARQSLARIDGDIPLEGLRRPVEVLRDSWGIPHIYAQNSDDLFLAQGFVAAQDRLWQLEIWKRSKQGRLAEILGPAAVPADRIARMTMYRGPMDEREWTSYHPEAKRIVTAFVNGVNAFIKQSAGNPPVEFRLTGIKPELWTPEVALLRATGFGDAAGELRLAQSVARLGVEEANRRAAPDPWDGLKVSEGLNVSLIGDEVLNATRGAGQLPKPQILGQYRGLTSQALFALAPPEWIETPGSNNWVVSPRLSKTGRVLLANDPHREVTLPALRHMVHLNAPGWNVIGSGEAAIPGVAIGHNERIAWGLTIVGTDQHDVFVEELNPEKPNEVRYNGRWEPLRIVREEIQVRGAPAMPLELKFSRHGVIFHEDRGNNRAYALRSALAEPGTAPYLGSLRLDQAKNCREFLDAMPAWKAPSENMICGDVEGNIAWEAAALTPSRKGWTGRLPVPGSGNYEWSGFRRDLPRAYNPASGWVATANHNIHPQGFTPPVMFKNPAAAIRYNRIREMIGATGSFGIDDFKRMQQDTLSTQAREELAIFNGWQSRTPEVETVRVRLARWDAVLRSESTEAALYMTWRQTVDRASLDRTSATAGRNAVVEAGLVAAIEKLRKDLGADQTQWRWGRINRQAFPHPVLQEFDLPAVERRGGGGTVAANGATYREIFDVGNWDAAIATMTPGQSGQPESPNYGNLLPLWAKDEYFPLLFNRKAVDEKVAHKLTLKPR